MSFKTSCYKNREVFREVNKKYKRGYRNRTGSNKYERRSWSKIDDARVLSHSISDRELSKEIERSVTAIQHRRYRLRNGIDNGK